MMRFGVVALGFAALALLEISHQAREGTTWRLSPDRSPSVTCWQRRSA